MSYEKTTWATDDTITANALNNMESGIETVESKADAADEKAEKGNPQCVPITLTEGEGGELTGATTAVFSEVKAEVIAKREVYAEVSLGNTLLFFASLKCASPAADPGALVFNSTIDFSDEPEEEGGEETVDVRLITITLTAEGVAVKVRPLAVAEEAAEPAGGGGGGGE